MGCACPLGVVAPEESSSPTIKNSKVPTADEAVQATFGFGCSDQESIEVASLFRLVIDAPGFGERGDWIWLVQYRNWGLCGGPVFKEIQVDSRTGAVRAMPIRDPSSP
jgi:hypothetical protein